MAPHAPNAVLTIVTLRWLSSARRRAAYRRQVARVSSPTAPWWSPCNGRSIQAVAVEIRTESTGIAIHVLRAGINSTTSPVPSSLPSLTSAPECMRPLGGREHFKQSVALRTHHTSRRKRDRLVPRLKASSRGRSTSSPPRASHIPQIQRAGLISGPCRRLEPACSASACRAGSSRPRPSARPRSHRGKPSVRGCVAHPMREPSMPARSARIARDLCRAS
jgi:hypothetical protein